MDTPLAARIRDAWPTLTRSDRLVARRLLSEYPSAGLKTLAELAGRAGVSAPSVIRCVKKLGFESYPEFQAVLHDEVQSAFDGEGPADHASDSVGELTEAEAAYLAGIRKTVKLTLDTELEEIGQLLAKSKASVLCLGGRLSQALALVFQANLLRLRRNVELVSTSPIERAERLMDVGKNDIVVLFDYQPYDQQSVSFAKLAADHKATVVCFTDTQQSPAAEHARYIVASENTSPNDVPSLTAALCSAEMVLGEVRERIGSRAQSRSRSIEKVPDVALMGSLDPSKA